MKDKLIYPLVALVLLAGAACRGDRNGATQQQYESVQEGSAAGVTSTIHGPGETIPPLTGTNADTTTAFTLDPNGTALATPPGTIAGTLPPPMPSGSGTYVPPPVPRTVPSQPVSRPQAPVTRQPVPQPEPQQPTETVEPVAPPPTDTTLTEPPPPTETAPPPAKPKKEEKPREQEEEQTDTAEPPPPPPPPPPALSS